MMKQQNANYQRPANFDRPAFRPDLERLSYARIPKAVCHPWARPIIDALSPAANKVYSLLISLAMVGKKGYAGLAEPDEVACRIVRRITDQKCELSTWRNGRRELVMKGLASRTYWTRPDQRIQNGKRTVIVPGGQRVHLGGDQWCTRQIRITLLTPAGAGLFDVATRNEMNEVYSLLPTPLKSSARSQIEDRRKPPKRGFSPSPNQTTSNNVSSPLTCNRRLDHELETSQNTMRGTSHVEGNEGSPTRPPCPAPPNDATIKHNNDLANPAIACCNTDADRAESRSFEQSSSFSNLKGCSAKRNPLPKGVSRKGKIYAKAKLLNILHQCLNNYPREEADELYSRCKTQIELSSISNWPTVINLPYWVDRSTKLTRRELVGYMRQRIIPGLKYSELVIPKEPKKFRTWSAPGPAPEKIEMPVTDLPDFLKNIAVKVGLE